MIIMPNQLPQPSVDNPLPWKAILHTGDFGGAVVAKSGHVVAELDNSEDAKFIAASASAFYNLVERYEYMRGLVLRMIPAVEKSFAIAKHEAESIKGICALKNVDYSEVDAVLSQWENLLREARAAIGKGDKP